MQRDTDTHVFGPLTIQPQKIPTQARARSVYKQSGLLKSLVGKQMSGKIFINYRRDDTSASAGRLYDRLTAHFPKNQIFIDVDNLDPGSCG